MSKIFRNKSIVQKIAIVVLITLLINFGIPTFSFAGSWGGDILKIFIEFLAAIGDIVMGAFNHWMLGTERIITSVMLSYNNPTITNPNGALYVAPEEVPDIKLDPSNEEEELEGFWDSLFGAEWEVPNLLYSPEAIFSNSIAALDVNFLRPNEYQAVQEDGDPDSTSKAEKASQSAAGMIKDTIGSWYVAFRNIAIVALLTVLVYIGIRILISSTSADKAKYKESLKDWLVAVCLVFAIHFIMSVILMLIDQITIIFAKEASGLIVEYEGTKMRLNLMGYARLRVQSVHAGVSGMFCIMYIVLIIYTVIFTFIYFKRFLYMAFLTMIAPLVAITYPLDKLGDGKAQAFNFWFKEYLMNALLQPIHLILYTTLVVSAQDLVKVNFLYAVVAIAFLIPAEKFVKQMFGFNKSESAGTLGGFAAGALAMKGLNALAKKAKSGSSGDKGNGGNNKIRTTTTNGELTGKSDSKGLDSVQIGNGDNSTNLNPPASSDGHSHLLDGYNINDYNGQASYKDYLKSDMKDLASRGAKTIGNTRIGQGAIKGAKAIGNTRIGQGAIKGAKAIAKSPIARTAIRGAKSIGKGVWKNKGKIGRVALGAATGVVGAGIGLAAGLASGDPSKVFSYATAGAYAGNAIGKGTANGIMSVGGAVKDSTGKIRDAYEEEKLGIVEANKRKQDRINQQKMKEFMKNEDQLAHAKKTQIKLAEKGHSASIEDIMKSRYDYMAAGITNDKMIERAQVAEARAGGINGSSHENYVGMAQAVEEMGINRNTFTDVKKFNELHNSFTDRFGNEENGATAMKMVAELTGAEKENKFQSSQRMKAQVQQPPITVKRASNKKTSKRNNGSKKKQRKK